ncbi:hypothetical protein [Bradyrhizobium centrosematis]|uniref:hypothetical protein n=1 Tax=Bradyrhizobium centrosematis TaxID=1300039 RepID=UPI002167D68E|nr:hypothetical protein [Bradyrhizobium centrosematis]MCS3759490.1 hypothetical protein [Bradyrhizobium centrosematis]MCS3772620.1 hypothetical protein [Bradyrhizobium centrosematis]
MVLGDGDAEHHHDDQDKPQRAPVGLSGRALRFPASRADWKPDRDLGLAELAGHRRLEGDGRGAGSSAAALSRATGSPLGSAVNAKDGKFVPVAAVGGRRPQRQKQALVKENPGQKKTPRFRAGLFWLTALGFQRLAASRSSNLKLKIQKATAPR